MDERFVEVLGSSLDGDKMFTNRKKEQKRAEFEHCL